jgi:hypothetical protein
VVQLDQLVQTGLAFAGEDRQQAEQREYGQRRVPSLMDLLGDRQANAGERQVDQKDPTAAQVLT